MKYRRVLIKLSGEALKGSSSGLFDFDTICSLSAQIKALLSANIEVAIVVGAGNILRGNQISASGALRKVSADHMGMMATHINAIALQDIFTQNKLPTRIMSAYPLGGAKVFESSLGQNFLKNGQVLILSGGTGNTCFTTDTCAALRAIELGADVLIKATKVDGIYSDDPVKNAHAQFFSHLNYQEAINQKLNVMDMTGFLLCSEHQLPIIVFNVFDQSILDVVNGKGKFSLVDDL